jgi:uncharacterized membrane protein
LKDILLYLQTAFYIWAGINHFRMPKFYLKMMPNYLPMHKQLVDWSGIAEIILGISLLFEQTRAYSAWGIILLLLAVFPANVFMLTSGKFSRIPKWFLYARFPLQILLIYWAYVFTK